MSLKSPLRPEDVSGVSGSFMTLREELQRILSRLEWLEAEVEELWSRLSSAEREIEKLWMRLGVRSHAGA